MPIQTFSQKTLRTFLFRSLLFIINHEIQASNDRFLQLAAVYDHIDHSVVEKKFAALKTFRQLLSYRLLDHAGPGKTNECFWLRHDYITQHSEARGYASGCWVGKNGNEWKSGVVKP